MNFSNPISSILKKDVVTIRPDTLAEDVKNVFNERKFHHLPVVDDLGKLVGIISKLDLYRMERLLGNRPESAPALCANDFMTKHPKFASPDDSLLDAAKVFLKNRIHALPVVKDQIVIGIITAHDLLAFALNISYDDDMEN